MDISSATGDDGETGDHRGFPSASFGSAPKECSLIFRRMGYERPELAADSNQPERNNKVKVMN